MNKLFAVTMVLAMAGTQSVLANEIAERTLFAGGMLGMGKTDLSMTASATVPATGIPDIGLPSISNFPTSISGNETKSITQFGAYVGQYVTSNIRVYAGYSYSKSDALSLKRSFKMGQINIEGETSSELSSHQLTASADYVFDLHSRFKPFAGATLGYSMNSFNLGGAVSMAGIKRSIPGITKAANQFIYGAQAGVLSQFDQFDVELGYRYLKNSVATTMQFMEHYNVALSAGDLHTPYVSVAYRF